MMETSFTFELTIEVQCAGYKCGVWGQMPDDILRFKAFLKDQEITQFLSQPERAELMALKLAHESESGRPVGLPCWMQVECEGLYRRGMDEPNEIMDFKVYLGKPDGRLDITDSISKAERKEIYDNFLEEVESHD